MADEVDRQERELIEQAIKDGKVTVCEPFARTIKPPEFEWNHNTGKLELKK